MAVTVYKSTDAGAPALTGQVGSLVALLDAILVNGYGAKPAAGWTKAFAGANLAAYRNNVATGTGFYLAVNDNAPGATAGAREAQARGFEVMTTVSAGTGAFPTTAQLAVSGVPIRKSSFADATSRPWKAYADNKTFYLFINLRDFVGWSGFAFGDIYAIATDPYRALIAGRFTQNNDTDAAEGLPLLVSTAVVASGHWMTRNWQQNGTLGAAAVGKHGDASKGGGAALTGFITYPNPLDVGLYMSPVWVHEDNGNTITIRGRMRGFWQQLHPLSAPINEGDTWSGTGPLAGKTFECVGAVADGSGKYVIETSDTWETN